jgi:hypothetical protein
MIHDGYSSRPTRRRHVWLPVQSIYRSAFFLEFHLLFSSEVKRSSRTTTGTTTAARQLMEPSQVHWPWNLSFFHVLTTGRHTHVWSVPVQFVSSERRCISAVPVQFASPERRCLSAVCISASKTNGCRFIWVRSNTCASTSCSCFCNQWSAWANKHKLYHVFTVFKLQCPTSDIWVRPIDISNSRLLLGMIDMVSLWQTSHVLASGWFHL